MGTEAKFRDDAYATNCEAVVTALSDRGGIVLNKTVFYPTGGGQPGDCGVLLLKGGKEVRIATAVKDKLSNDIIHILEEGQTLPQLGVVVTAEIDWPHRYRLMRMHTCLHVLSAVLPYPVTGGQVGPDRGRLDFDIPEAGLNKDQISTDLNRLVCSNIPVQAEWITDAELDANPDLVKTMSVQPPRGNGHVRLIRIGELDLQPCGGTHVNSTGEIGPVRVTKIQKKGRQNRRVSVELCK